MESRFVRDSASLALVNNDAEGLAAYRRIRDQAMTIESLKTEINTCKLELMEIRNLLSRTVPTP